MTDVHKVTPTTPQGQAEPARPFIGVVMHPVMTQFSLVEILVFLESLHDRNINPFFSVSENLRGAILAEVNWGRYQAGEVQFATWDAYLAGSAVPA